MNASFARGVPRFMPILGGIILIAVALYYTFWAINSLGLEHLSGVATVTGKEYRPAGTSYQSERVAGRNYVRTLQTPEQYIVTLDLLNQPVAGTVDSMLYNALKPGERVQVTYQRQRLTNSMIVQKIAATNQGDPF
jgi:hypothetical protein